MWSLVLGLIILQPEISRDQIKILAGDLSIIEYVPFSPKQAMEAAVPVPRLRAEHISAIRNLFHPVSGWDFGGVLDVRVAVGYRDQWIFVDRGGYAFQRNDTTGEVDMGYFDLGRFELYLRDLARSGLLPPEFPEKFVESRPHVITSRDYGMITNLDYAKITNRTDRQLEVRPYGGYRMAVLSPKESIFSFLIPLGRYEFYVDGNLVGVYEYDDWRGKVSVESFKEHGIEIVVAPMALPQDEVFCRGDRGVSVEVSMR
jgi:hypothetical protein